MKIVMQNYYCHKLAIQELLDAVPEREHIRKIIYGLDSFYDYEVIKYDSYNHRLSLIKSPDWFTSHEPIVGDSVVFDLSIGNDLSDTPKKFVKGRTKNFQIYHSKELFMPIDYDILWMDAARKRTELWQSIPDIKKHKSKIGNQDYWFALLDANGIER